MRILQPPPAKRSAIKEQKTAGANGLEHFA